MKRSTLALLVLAGCSEEPVAPAPPPTVVLQVTGMMRAKSGAT